MTALSLTAFQSDYNGGDYYRGSRKMCIFVTLYSAAKSGARIQPERTGATGPRLERGGQYLNSEGQ